MVAVAPLVIISGALLLGQRHSGQTSQTPTAAHGRLASPQPSIKLYLRADASPAVIRDTIAAVTHEQGVARVTFVSRAEAFRIMKHRYPNLLSHVVYNPLTDMIDVQLTTDRARSSIVPQLKRLRGVERIAYSTASKNK
jgi:cell division protein FtsX